MPWRPQRRKSPGFILVHELPGSQSRRYPTQMSQQSQPTAGAGLSFNTWEPLLGSQEDFLELFGDKVATSLLEKVCWGGLWGGLLLARTFDLLMERLPRPVSPGSIISCSSFMGALMMSGKTWSISSMIARIQGWWPKAWSKAMSAQSCQ